MKFDERTPLTDEFLRKELMTLFWNMRYSFISFAIVFLLVCPLLLWGCFRTVSDPAFGILQKCIGGAGLAFVPLTGIAYLIGAACELCRFYRSVQNGDFRVVKDTLKHIPEPGESSERPRFAFIRRDLSRAGARFCFENHGTFCVPMNMKNGHAAGDAFYLVLIGERIERVYSVRGYKKCD